jgi:hypothetical protein
MGTQVAHLGVGRVVEVQGGRCLVKVDRSYKPIQPGDEVKLYEDEVQRGQQSRRMEKLPSSEIQCRVCGGDPWLDRYTTNDYVILSAGSEQGVVAGQVFLLRQRDTKPGWKGPADATVGRVKVFYAGPDYSMAKVLMNSIPVTRGTRALYSP